MAAGAGWPQLSTCSSLGALIHLFNSRMPVSPWGQCPSCLSSSVHKEIAWEKKKRSWWRRHKKQDHVGVTVWCSKTLFQSGPAAPLSFFPMQEKQQPPLYELCGFVYVSDGVSVCVLFWCILFDGQGKTSKVFTPLHKNVSCLLSPPAESPRLPLCLVQGFEKVSAHYHQQQGMLVNNISTSLCLWSLVSLAWNFYSLPRFHSHPFSVSFI